MLMGDFNLMVNMGLTKTLKYFQKAKYHVPMMHTNYENYWENADEYKIITHNSSVIF